MRGKWNRRFPLVTEKEPETDELTKIARKAVKGSEYVYWKHIINGYVQLTEETLNMAGPMKMMKINEALNLREEKEFYKVSYVELVKRESD